MQQKTVSVIYADDHELVREGIATVLNKQKDITVLGEASNGEQLVQLTELHHPDVILTDIKMPVMDGIEAVRIISKKFPEIGIIVLTMYDDDKLVSEMLDCGADGYLLKGTPKNEILQAIKSVSENKSYYCKEISRKLAHSLLNAGPSKGNTGEAVHFSYKEKVIIELICKEFSNRQIASKLGLSIRSVESHRERLLAKTGSQNSPGLVVYVMKHKIYEP